MNKNMKINWLFPIDMLRRGVAAIRRFRAWRKAERPVLCLRDVKPSDHYAGRLFKLFVVMMAAAGVAIWPQIIFANGMQFIWFELERLKRPRLFNPYVDGAAGLAREFLIRGDVAQAAFLILDGGANPDPAELEYIESWIISAIEQAEQAQEAAE